MADHQHDEIVRKSHERSRKYGIQEKQSISHKILDGDELNNLLSTETPLRELASPVIEDFYNLLESTGFIVILTDEDACVLDVKGEPETVERARKSNIFPGAFLNEENIGTNAMGTAIKEDGPVQISAEEHYIQAFHVWTCSAAPIHDPDGNIIGTLNFTADKSKVHPHTLGLVIAAVKAIESKLEYSRIQSLLYDSQQYAFTIMNNLSFGVITLSNEGEIEWINDFACIQFNIRRSLLIDSHVNRLLDDWEGIRRKVLSGEQLYEKEVVFKIKDQNGVFSLNAFPIYNPQGDGIGILLIFREMERIINLVNKYTGMQARFSFKDIIGDSSRVMEVIDYAKTVARSPSTILIQGDSGTGKEVFAQAIHNASDRHHYGFVALNCGAIPANLIESELFGYDEGAFTGAKKGGHPGKFELANKGTLFLDEIGEMPMDMQVRLLRALQEGSFTRVGGEKPLSVDVRIIAATNKNLKDEIDKGNFRLDLYYRLSVIPIKIPSLKERKEDILPLVNYFLRSKSIKLKKNIPRLSDQLLKQLFAYDWPGNIRELENFIEKAVLLNGKIQLEPDKYQNEPKKEHTDELPSFLSEESNKLLSLDEIEAVAISAYLKKLDNNITKVAHALNIGRNTLYKKMEKYNIKY